MDGFTASALLEASKTDVQAAANLYKALNECSEGAPNEAQKEWVESNLNKRVKIKGTDHEGYILRLNKASSGFYPGGRYPVIVKLDIGYTFEYGIDSVILDEQQAEA